ncbi:hypothetical protein BGZ96_007893 [Linnemannia gamsii]|uniref:Cation-transporting P-type ATPase N-terminal domain-containing protein n=1 Tax=Linnemannia gamsii TaxID=64522 RepID=A0ABQ7KDN8_9FUNG|nr:hypothetical protein BGZ96_007893 [Linnemannia gamsii]
MARDKERKQSLALVRTQTMERARGNAAPIEFRTLSIHVTETHRSEKNGGMPAYGKERELKSSRFWKGKRKEDDLVIETDFFSAVDFHKLPESEINLRFNSESTTGLTQQESSRRLKANGLNTLDSPKPNYFKMIIGYTFGGFCSILWLGVITFLICAYPPLSPTPNVTNLALAILVLFVIILQAGFSAFQDFSTAKVMSSILDMIPAECHVIRDGQLVKIPASGLVVGDRVHLSLGNKVPADLRIIQASSDTRFDRAVLTGESEAIEASTIATDDNFLESKNIAFMGTHVVQGSCVGVVILKGNDTLMGRINKLTRGRKPKKTIIQREITRFIQIIVALTVALILIITIAWAAWQHRVYPDFMNVTTLLVTLMGCVIAFIPEGVPVCISLTLLMIARRMRENDILPKALSTVETLGCVNVICSDKTGTLTENKMHVSNVAFLDYESTPSDIAASLAKSTQSPDQLPKPDDGHLSLSLRQLQLATLLCNNARFDPETMQLPLADRKVLGDATDSALLRFAHQVSDTSAFASSFERTFEIPFNSRNKWMMTAHQGSRTNPQLIKVLFGSNIMDANNTVANEKDDMLVFVKGAPDVLLPYCSSFWSATTSNGPQPLTPEWAAELTRIQQTWSSGGKRVLMLCKGRYSPYLAQHNLNMAGSSTSNAIQEELTRQGLQELCILGLVGIMDPPREEIKDTIRACRGAGARFFMVTGDFGLTATAIAKQIGLFSTEREPHTYENIMDPNLSTSNHDYEKAHSDDDSSLQHVEVGRPWFREGTSLVLTGSELAKMSPGEWDLVCTYEEIVFARTSPEQKLRIVTEFQRRDGVVAVTGDGVNDAPALKAADVGVAVVSGSDVAIEAADLILLGGFDAIPEAIRLGRLAFQNLQKVIGYLLPAGSWSEVWPVLINVFLGAPLSLSSFLMVIVCCFTDAFPCTALVMEQEEFDLLSLQPRNSKKEHLITLKIYAQSYFFIGSTMTFFCNMFFFLYLKEYTGVGFSDLVFTFGDLPKEKLAARGISLEEFSGYYVNTAQCVCFVTLVIMQWGNLLSVRNRRMSILQADPFRKQRRNLWLFLGILASFLVAILVTETPGIQEVMLTNSVPIKYWLLPLPCALFVVVADDVRKLIVRVFPRSILARIAW